MHGATHPPALGPKGPQSLKGPSVLAFPLLPLQVKNRGSESLSNMLKATQQRCPSWGCSGIRQGLGAAAHSSLEDSEGTYQGSRG